LIGFQNDYFSKDGILNGAFEDANAIDPSIKGSASLKCAFTKSRGQPA